MSGSTLLALVPLIIVELGLLVFAVLDVVKPERTVRGGNKLIWLLVIVFANPIGAIVYLFVGREGERAEEMASAPTGNQPEHAAVLSPTTLVRAPGGIAIRSQGVAKRFGTFEALSDLTFDVQEGSITGFLGLNGAGKTTMLRILSGLSSPSAGRAEVMGREVERSDVDGRRLVGVVPDVPAFPGWMKATEVLEYVGGLEGFDSAKSRQRAHALLDVAGLSDAGDRRVAGFSRGMKQRLGIAQALVADPPVLLLDEPVSALDPAGRRDVLDLIERLHGKRTVFFSTHILNDVERICDAVVIIHKGKVVAQSSVADLRDTVTTHTLEIEVTGDVTRLTAELNAASYVDHTDVETFNSRSKIVVWPKDLTEASARIPSLVATDGLVLNRYEWVTPDLEAVFLNLVGDTGPHVGEELP